MRLTRPKGAVVQSKRTIDDVAIAVTACLVGACSAAFVAWGLWYVLTVTP